MAAGLKCPGCGMMQMARPTCKSCGSPLGGPAQRPSPLQPPQQEFAPFRGAEQDSEERPQAVKTAVKVLWGSMAVGLVKIPLDFAHLRAMVAMAPVAALIGGLSGYALIAFLIAKISAGRNWARIVWLILSAIGVPLNFAIISAEFTRAPGMGALSLLAVGMQVYGLFLLFTRPGSVWFRKYKFA